MLLSDSFLGVHWLRVVFSWGVAVSHDLSVFVGIFMRKVVTEAAVLTRCRDETHEWTVTSPSPCWQGNMSAHTLTHTRTHIIFNITKLNYSH